MKVLLIDVDGVLNNDNTNATAPSGAMGVSDSKIKLLKQIVDATGAKVVLCSSWKNDIDGKDYNYLSNKLYHKGGIKIYSQTPNISSSRRGLEISAWLAQHPEVTNWVVIDDIRFSDYDRREFAQHLVITNTKYGLIENDVEKAIEILNCEE